ncbi:MAG: hypothetical protein OQK79_10160 [Rhodanobacter sp.]|jgi:hypothetical protein|nr:hypothetical protein [Rhodanobacter sp.]
MTVRRVHGFDSRSLPSHPLRFVYFTSADEHLQHAVYLGNLVIAEVLLHRLMRAKARGMQPVNMHLNAEAGQHFLRRVRPDSRCRSSAEFVRWVDRDGFSRSRPLNREQLTCELMDQQGISLSRAIERVITESRALTGEDQAWMEARSRLPALDRPLDGSEYLALVRAIEAAYAVPKGSTSSCAANAAVALRVARGLGWLHQDYSPSPFRLAALSIAYKTGHHDYLTRRASFVCATGERLRFSRAKPRVKMDVKLAEQRTAHAAFLARRAMAATAEICGGQFPALEVAVAKQRADATVRPALAVFARPLHAHA